MAGGKYFYSKGEGNDGYIKNLEVLGYCDLDGKAGMFQMALYRTEAGRYLLYGAAFAAGPDGSNQGLTASGLHAMMQQLKRKKSSTLTCPRRRASGLYRQQIL